MTMVYSSDFFFFFFNADKAHVARKLSIVNVAALNKVLWLEIFVTENGQLQAVHLVLDFKPLSNAFQDAGHAIRAGNPKIHRIDISRPGFLAREELPSIELLLQRSPQEVATLPRWRKQPPRVSPSRLRSINSNLKKKKEH